MKKIVLSIFAILFVAGCANSKPKAAECMKMPNEQMPCDITYQKATPCKVN